MGNTWRYCGCFDFEIDMALTNDEKATILHAFKAIANARLQLFDFKEYKDYEDEVIGELSTDLKLALLTKGE